MTRGGSEGNTGKRKQNFKGDLSTAAKIVGFFFVVFRFFSAMTTENRKMILILKSTSSQMWCRQNDPQVKVILSYPMDLRPAGAT